ncbi:hypothetical protein WKH57_01640 [Niallia taxi]|uniref:hypothetical protein n=1 Tax=Niallia taxi TaxID=2499688 RepID=UPI00317F2948
MIKPEKIDWSEVKGLNCGLWIFSNEDNYPVSWNEEEKRVEVLNGDVPIIYFKKSEIRDVIYK